MRNKYCSPSMKRSAFISPDPRQSKPKRIIRQSETMFSRGNTTNNFFSKDSSAEKSRIETEVLCSSVQISKNNSQDKRTKGLKECSVGIDALLKNLKMNYPKQSQVSRIKRVKSDTTIAEKEVNPKSQKFKIQIAQIKNKLAKYKTKTNREEPIRRSQLITSRLTSPSKVDLAAQKCKELCLNLKKKVLKETVSTTSPDQFQDQLNITQFSLGKLLGKGKFSNVYLARHHRSGLLVALKIIRKETIRKQNFVNQLARQIATQAFFNHVNLVRLYGIFSDETNVYLIVQFCPNGQLYDIFKLKSKLKEEEWSPIMKGICEGIYSLHLNDVIHRDLKPENILLAFGLPKIGDFGWAVYTPGDRRDTFCGTPLYISPELLMGGSYDKQVDIWALGVMMYEYVTGRIPFKLNSNKKFIEAVNGKIEYPEFLSEHCLNLLKMILNKDPEARIAILDILEHPFLKDCLTGTTRLSNLSQMCR